MKGALTDKYCPDPHVWFPHTIAGGWDSPLQNDFLPAISSGVGVSPVSLVVDVTTERIVGIDGREVSVL